MKNKELINTLKHVQDIMFDQPDEALKIVNSIKLKELDLEDFYEFAMVVGDILYYADDLRAIDYYKKALEVPILNKDEAKCYCHIGDCYTDKEEYALAIKNYEKVLQMGDKVDKKILGKTFFGLATVYLRTNNYEKAITFYQKTTELFENQQSEPEKVYYENSLSLIGKSYWMIGDIKRSEEYFLKVINITNATPWILAKIHAFKAHRLFENKKWGDALLYYQKAAAITDSKSNKKEWQEYAKVCENELKRNKGVRPQNSKEFLDK